jgi:quinol monooxygenase YgiN
MKTRHGTLIAAAILSAVPGPAALAQTAGTQSAYAVTYITVAPSAAAEAEAAGLLRRVAAASRKEAGNLRYEVLQQVDRRNQFAILEAWSDAKAFDAHGGGPAMKEFRGHFDPLRAGFYDQRPLTGVDVGPGPSPASKDAIYVVTHVDVPGQFKDQAIVMMNKLATGSRREPGLERYEVLQQPNRTNHFTVVDVWKDQPALDAHDVAAGTLEFREKIGPVLGALYDDRRYKSLE